MDRVAIALSFCLSLPIALLLWRGSTTVPRVRAFSWQDKTVGAEDTAFVLTFNRPMDRASVAENLTITPPLPLPGKLSWAGQRLVYTLPIPAPYGNLFEVRLQNAKDRASTITQSDQAIQPFTGRFRTRDRAFVYIGIEAKEAGRLILYNLTQSEKRLLTPPNLQVLDFEPYPQGDRILFSAADRSDRPEEAVDPKLYRVKTGIPLQPSEKPKSEKPKSEKPKSDSDSVTDDGVELVLDNQKYRNLKFDLSPDGQIIAVQRVNKESPGDFGLWILKPDAEPQPMNTKAGGGDFLIAPDSASLAMAQGQGVAILPFEEQAEPLDFLPKFGTILNFSQDGTAAVMVKFNTDYTRSLFLITNQGVQKQLLQTTGSILSAQFDPQKQTLYCLITELVPGETYREQPYVEAVDLKTGQRTKLLRLSEQRDINLSLAPDGLAILLDQPIPKPPSAPIQANERRTSTGDAIATSRLWILPLNYQRPESGTRERLQPESLPFPGVYPRWLP